MTSTANALSSAALADRIRTTDFSGRSATVLGYGTMGKQYVKALRSLGVGRIRVCSRSAAPLEELRDVTGVQLFEGGYQKFREAVTPGELGIVATPNDNLVDATTHLLACGFRKLLIEKPVSLFSREIESLASRVTAAGAHAACAYNRIAYPSFHEALFRATEDGGITSCNYAFTEFVPRIGPGKFTTGELERWGVANSLHVLSMAHGLIGLPRESKSFRAGSIDWHRSGAVFTGAGVSMSEVPFSYQADWGSTGRWSVEVHTHKSSYKFEPLESLSRRSVPAGPWEPVTLTAAFPEVKAGIAEEVAAMLMEPTERPIALTNLVECAQLTRYAEQVFGYAS